MIPTFFEAAVQSAAACFKAGQASYLEFVIFVQGHAAELQTIGNDRDEESCKERTRLVNELYERSSALIKAAKGGA